jgi:hypothetical protein
MPVVTCLVGLCGSGKTIRARELEAATGAKPFDGIFAESIEGRAAWDALCAALRAALDCTVEEVMLCFPENRIVFEQAMKNFPNVSLRWEYFAKDLESANWNIRHSWKMRGKPDVETHISINSQLMPRYEIPQGADVRPIVRCPGGRQGSE